MTRNVGSLVFLLVFTLSIFSMQAVKLVLNLYDDQGNVLKQAAVGEPFIVELIISNVTNTLGEPVLSHSPELSITIREHRLTTFNNTKSLKIVYQVLSNTEGTYTIGPASFPEAISQEKSNILSIKVAAEVIRDRQHNDTKNEPFFTLDITKNEAFVGELINGFVAFYYLDDTTVLKIIQKLELAGMRAYVNRENYITGNEVKNGVNYKYIKFMVQLVAEQEGSFILPALRADYEKKIFSSQRMPGFGFFTFDSVERQHVYSRPVKLQIYSLPFYAEEVNAIGHFSRITLAIEATKVKRGEGIVLSLEFEGEGDLAAIKTPSILNLPEDIKYYESNYTITPAPNMQSAVGRFEYILQGLRAGTWTIPSQKFTVFDTVEGRYLQFNTDPITITVEDDALLNDKQPENSLSSSKKNGMNTIMDETNDIYLIAKEGSCHFYYERSFISLWIFVLIILFPLLILISMAVRYVIKSYLHRTACQRLKNKSFGIAKTALVQALVANKPEELYHIFKQLIAARLMINEEQVSVDMIANLLKKHGMSLSAIEEWYLFFSRLCEARFSQGDENVSIFTQAQRWLDLFKGII